VRPHTDRDEIDVDGGQHRRRARGAGVDHDLEPCAEAGGIELLVPSWRRRPPQVEIEHTCQLLGCRQRHDWAAVFQPVPLNHAMEHIRLQTRHDMREVRCVHDAIEEVLRTPRGGSAGMTRSATHAFRHGPAIIPGLRRNKQS
jgi:hypothetical protein